MIPFNRPAVTGDELRHIQVALGLGKLSGDGRFTMKVQAWLEERAGRGRAFLTHSCTAALEMAAILLDVCPGDEVIMPSYTFVSTANAFALRGATIVFVDIRPDTMNLDETRLEAAITDRSRAIVVVHYAGVSCEMDTILSIAARRGLAVIEDAAQGVMAAYKGRALGTMGIVGCYSFHETKNYTAGGVGGAALINAPELVARAEMLRENGTDRARFFRGQADQYTWRDLGSSYLLSELQAAYLWGNLEAAETISARRLALWRRYRGALLHLGERGVIELPAIPEECAHNAHMFYIKLRDAEERGRFIEHMTAAGVATAFHYVPLHTSPAGRRYGRFHGEDRHTTTESGRLLRLPLYYNMSDESQHATIRAVLDFFG
jgi:dTDP-4-amino-4,6-dideoxygalactose transaminase